MDYSAYSTMFILDKVLHKNKITDIEEEKLLMITYEFLKLNPSLVRSSVNLHTVLHEPKDLYLMSLLLELNKDSNNLSDNLSHSNKDKETNFAEQIIKEGLLDEKSLTIFFNNQLKSQKITLSDFLKLQWKLAKLGVLNNSRIAKLSEELRVKLIDNKTLRDAYFLKQVNEIKFKFFKSTKQRKKLFNDLYHTLNKKILAEDCEMIKKLIKSWLINCGNTQNEYESFMNTAKFNQICEKLNYNHITDYVIKYTLRFKQEEYDSLEKIICSVNNYKNYIIPSYIDEIKHSSVYTKMESSKSIGKFIKINKRN